jgi:acetyl-CoA carboxylase biotin carboxyl carrier protein
MRHSGPPDSGTPDITTDPGNIRALAEMCTRAGVEEISASDGAWSVRLRLDHSAIDAARVVAETSVASESTSPYQLISQSVGVFHRSADAGMPSYVEEGQDVLENDIVGVIAAMQLQHEVRVDRPGRLTRFLVQDGTAVEFGQPLLEIG